jgi:HD-GYP domain-containing protein (c-di-GMP phosphodiesterase class II)
MREDLYAFDGTLIVRQGEIITPRVIEEIQQSNTGPSSDPVLLDKTELFDDFCSVVNEDNYRTIFHQEEFKDKLLDLMGEVELLPEIVKELDFFKIQDYYTYRHILITTILTVRMVHDISQDPQQARLAASTALTHDFGKARIPLDILQSSKKLTYDEYVYIMEHPWIGYLLLTYYTGRKESAHAQVAFNHHEKKDGSGYPRGIHVEDPLIQFVTINDMFDALISHRPYRLEPFNVRGALDFLCDEAEGGRLNMTGVKLLLSYNRLSNPPIDSLVYSTDHLGYVPPDEMNNYSDHADYPELDGEDNPETEV